MRILQSQISQNFLENSLADALPKYALYENRAQQCKIVEALKISSLHGLAFRYSPISL